MDIYNDLTLIMVTYRSENLVKKNLEILKKFKTIIVDNSNSRHLNEIVKDFENIKIIISKKNLGYGKAANLAISYAKTSLILTVNPDLILNIDGIQNLINEYQKDAENIGILSPSLYNEKMQRRTNGTVTYLNQLKGKKVFNNTKNLPEGNMCCEFLEGCCYLINRNFFNKLGGFDERFFMYFEDTDLCDRSIKNGKYIMEIPSSKFIHIGNSSSDKKKFTNSKLSIIHKISCYIYLKKKTKTLFLVIKIFKDLFDYLQRAIFNTFKFRFNKSFKNILRLISIILYITKLYKPIYKYWKL